MSDVSVRNPMEHLRAIQGTVLDGDALVCATLRLGENGVARMDPAGTHDVDTVYLPSGWVATPGLVDLQVNGYVGVEVDQQGGIAVIADALARDGVVAFCPTLISRPVSEAVRTIANIQSSVHGTGARVIGVHLEGPWLSAARPGAHRTGFLDDPSSDDVAAVVAASPALVTLAPERPGATTAIRSLHAAGVRVAVGHTECDAATMNAAISAGASMVTHAFNAMPGISARGAGGLARALTHPDVHIGLIADGVHVSPETIRVATGLAGRRLVLVSDAVSAAGMPPGAYPLGECSVRFDGTAVRRDDGTLAGAAAPLWKGVATLVDAGVPRAAALYAATIAPRCAMGLASSWQEGITDLVIVDDQHRPRAVMISGRWIPDLDDQWNPVE